MQGFVILQFIILVILELTGYHIMYSQICGWDIIESTGQYIYIGGIRFPRFMGTTTEAGYLAPLLVMPIYYFVSEFIDPKKKKIQRYSALKYLIMCYLLAFFTFSTAVYGFVVLISLIVLIDNIRKKRTTWILMMILFFFIVFVVAVVVIPSLSTFFQNNFLNKILAYTGKENVSNWSANDRSQHLSNAWNMFLESNPIQFVIGHGTGGYYARSKVDTGLLVSDVDEAYNLFLSSLTDRGLIGFVCLIAVVLYIRKFKTNSIY